MWNDVDDLRVKLGERRRWRLDKHQFQIDITKLIKNIVCVSGGGSVWVRTNVSVGVVTAAAEHKLSSKPSTCAGQ